MLRRAAVGIALFGASMVGCGARGEAPIGDPEPAPSAEAAARVRTLEARFVTAPLASARARRGGVRLGTRRLLQPSDAALAFDGAAIVATPRGARPPVRLPARADSAMSIGAGESSIDVDIVAAEPRNSAIVDGLALYRGAVGSADLVRRVARGGVEDYFAFDAPPPREEVRYRVRLGPGVAGLRVVERVVEVVDAGAAPRVRMAAPWIFDARGRRLAAAVTVEGCAFDASPRPPWGRPVVAPGSNACEVRVSWEGLDAAYPLLVDPLWTATSDMTTWRRGGALVLLKTGKALAVGGDDGTDYLGSAELFDPMTKTWAATGSLPAGEEREDLAAAVLGDGRALAAGGGASTTLVTCWLYDPVGGTWAPTGSLATPRSDIAATVLSDGRVLIAGGHNEQVQALTTAEIFDPTANAWSSAGTMPSDHAAHTQTLLEDGRVLVVGGYTSFTSADGHAALFDPANGSWAPTGSMMQSRVTHTANLLPTGKVLVAAGTPAPDGEPVVTAELYDATAGTWTMTGSLATERDSHGSATLATGNVLVLGGCTGFACASVLYSAEAYDVASAKWVTVAPMLDPRGEPGVVTLASGAVLVAGGFDGFGALETAEVFTPGALAQPCSVGEECASGHCVDGICCDATCAGSCEACTAAKKGSGTDGTCAPVAAGTDPDSDCLDSGGAVCGDDGLCDGAGACQKYATATGCAARSCTMGSECASGFCVDGVCCDKACDAVCQTCVKAKGSEKDGVCQFTPRGSDPDGDCPDMGTAVCSTVSLCDGAGQCGAADIVCAPYKCASASACGTTCSADTDCAAGAHCASGACIAAAATCDAKTGIATAADGKQIACAPYECNADGTCRTTCGSVDNCVAPNVCDTSGHCVALATGDASSGGCGCRIAGEREARGALALAVAGITGALRRRRRKPRGGAARVVS